MNSLRRYDTPLDDRILVTRCETPGENEKPFPVVAESPTAWASRAALLAHDVQECRFQSERAGAQRDISAVAPLTTLLQPPRSMRMRLKHRQWGQARLSAVRALEQIGTEATLPPLARALLDPSPLVQSAAAHALERIGPSATLAVTAVFHDPGDWPLSGMKRLISTLGQLHTPQANACLVPLVLGRKPAAPSRWKLLFHAFMACGGGISILAVLDTLYVTRSIALALYYGLLVLLVIGCLGAIVGLFSLLPIYAWQESHERSALAVVASEELCRQTDKRHLPALIEGAFCYYYRVRPALPKPVHRAVLHTLRLVNADDAMQLPNATRQHLMDALGRGYGNDIDLALLRVCEWIGNGETLLKVERIASRGATEELRDEAARVLPVLQERQRNAQAPAMLLRPSQAGATRPEQLLRPGYATDTTPAVQLLRPTQGE